MPRFVVLEHELPPQAERATHWDLMIEQGAALATWALQRPPAPDVAIAAEALDDHRPSYLDYEGPISGDRGRVRRWDAGECRVVSQSSERWVVEFVGSQLAGVATLESDANRQNWTFSWSAASRR